MWSPALTTTTYWSSRFPPSIGFPENHQFLRVILACGTGCMFSPRGKSAKMQIGPAFHPKTGTAPPGRSHVAPPSARPGAAVKRREKALRIQISIREAVPPAGQKKGGHRGVAALVMKPMNRRLRSSGGRRGCRTAAGRGTLPRAGRCATGRGSDRPPRRSCCPWHPRRRSRRSG